MENTVYSNEINKALFIGVLCLLLSCTAYGQQQKDTLFIEGEKGSSIFVDSVYAGNGSVTVLLPLGIHIVTFTQDASLWNPVLEQDSVLLTGNGDRQRVFSGTGFGNPGFPAPDTKATYSLMNSAVLTQTMERNGIVKDKLFFQSHLFKYLSGSLIVFGVSAAYLKIKADHRYDDYLLTRDNGVLQETRRLDTYSGVAFAVTQINLAALVYFFLADQ